MRIPNTNKLKDTLFLCIRRSLPNFVVKKSQPGPLKLRAITGGPDENIWLSGLSTTSTLTDLL